MNPLRCCASAMLAPMPAAFFHSWLVCWATLRHKNDRTWLGFAWFLHNFALVLSHFVALVAWWQCLGLLLSRRFTSAFCSSSWRTVRVSSSSQLWSLLLVDRNTWQLASLDEKNTRKSHAQQKPLGFLGTSHSPEDARSRSSYGPWRMCKYVEWNFEKSKSMAEALSLMRHVQCVTSLAFRGSNSGRLAICRVSSPLDLNMHWL